ncbi:MAG: hypothetical protein AMJ46_09430 [Latescibacteria bacterium DG_63]|nr:MAG: hypothetical protein AMJ46_09430 [Latescibacteria bacterium DG_63]
MSRHERTPAGTEVLGYVRAIKRRIGLVLLPVVLVPCVAIVGVSFVAPMYECSSIILYEESRPFAGGVDKMIVQSASPGTRSRDRLAQVETRLEGRLFLEEVIQKLGMNLSERAVEGLRAAQTSGVSLEELKTSMLIGAMRENIKVSEIGPDLFRITLSHPDRDMAFLLGDGITRMFVEHVTRGQLADIRAVGTFSEDQLPVYEEKVRESEEKLRRFRSQMASRSVREGFVNDDNVERARTLLSHVDAEIAEISARLATSRERVKTSYPNAVDPTTLIRSKAIASSYSHVVKEEEISIPLLVEGAPTGSMLERVGQARETLLARIEDAVRGTLRGSPQALQSLVTEIVYDEHIVRSLTARKQKISSQITSYSRNLARQPQDEMQLRRLEQEVENDRAVLQSFRQQLTSSRISEAAQTTNLGVRIEIIEPPARPLVPAGPGREKILILAFLLGPFLGISFVVLSEYMDDSVKSVEDLTKNLGLAVLGTIPRVPSDELWHPLKKRKWIYIVAFTAVLLAATAHLAREPLLNALSGGRRAIEATTPYQQSERVTAEDEGKGTVGK